MTFGSASGGMKSPVSRGRFTHPALVKLRVKRYDVVPPPPRCFKEHWCQERDKKPQVCDATGRGLGVKSALWRRVHDRSGLKKKKHITRASAFTIAKTTEKKTNKRKYRHPAHQHEICLFPVTMVTPVHDGKIV